jgi:hypothetical protein
LANRGRDLIFTAANVKLPSMPGACDNVARKGAFAKWASLMGADPVQRIKRTVDVEQRDDPSGGYNFQARARRTLAHLRQDDWLGRITRQ